MSPLAAEPPVAIERVDRTRGGGEDVRLRILGRATSPGPAGAEDPLLVVSINGRRHRFPSSPLPADAAPPPPGVWEAVFTIPSWAEPVLPGQAALWLGDLVIPVPPPGEAIPAKSAAGVPGAAVPAPAVSAPAIRRFPAPWALGEAAPWPPEGPTASSPAGPAVDPVVDTGRTGPLAELLFKESVTALHEELERSSADAARLRGELADARAELEARSRMQVAVDAAQAELRAELARLSAAATRQREEHEARLDELGRRLQESEERLAAAETERARAREQAEQARDGAREELEAERERSRRELEAERRRVRAELEAERSNLTQAAEAQRARAVQEAEAERARALGEVEAERTRVAAELEALRAERDAALAERDAALAERDAAVAERDAAVAEAAELQSRLDSRDAGHEQFAAELAALREQLALAHVTRDAAVSEASGLRGELERLGVELAVSREQLGARGGDLAETERLLADARALTAQLRGETTH